MTSQELDIIYAGIAYCLNKIRHQDNIIWHYIQLQKLKNLGNLK